MQEELMRLAKSADMRKQTVKENQMMKLKKKVQKLEKNWQLEDRRQQEEEDRRELKESEEAMKNLLKHYTNQTKMLTDELHNTKYENNVATQAQKDVSP